MIAQEDGECGLCGQPIRSKVDPIVPRGDGWIHRSCAPGQDDAPQQRATKARRKPATTTPADGVSSGEGNDTPASVPPVERGGVPAPSAGPALVTEIPENPDGWVCRNLDETVYHAHAGSLSSTGVKTLLKAPALFDHQRHHPVHKSYFDYGSASHLYALGIGPEVVEVEKTDTKTGARSLATDWKTPSARAMRDQARAEGKIGMLAKDHAKVQDMAKVLMQHELATSLLSKGEPEVSGFKVDAPTGVMRRGRADWIRKRVLVDYKTTGMSADPSRLGRTAYDNGWYIQAPFYFDLFTELGWNLERVFYIVQETEAPYLVSVVVLDHQAMQLGRAHYRDALERFRDCTEAGIWPGYRPPTDASLLTLPGFAYVERPDDKVIL